MFFPQLLLLYLPLLGLPHFSLLLQHSQSPFPQLSRTTALYRPASPHRILACFFSHTLAPSIPTTPPYPVTSAPTSEPPRLLSCHIPSATSKRRLRFFYGIFTAVWRATHLEDLGRPQRRSQGPARGLAGDTSTHYLYHFPSLRSSSHLLPHPTIRRHRRRTLPRRSRLLRLHFIRFETAQRHSCVPFTLVNADETRFLCFWFSTSAKPSAATAPPQFIHVARFALLDCVDNVFMFRSDFNTVTIARFRRNPIFATPIPLWV
jgi:hypothetical protein